MNEDNHTYPEHYIPVCLARAFETVWLSYEWRGPFQNWSAPVISLLQKLNLVALWLMGSEKITYLQWAVYSDEKSSLFVHVSESVFLLRVHGAES